METVVPYLPRIDWFSSRDKILYPNRCELAPASLLTIPIEGGRPQMKRVSASEWRLSGHGNWRHVHLQTIKTILGRMPYYNHFIPEFEEILMSRGDGSLFVSLTKDLLDWVERSLCLPELGPKIRVEMTTNRSLMQYAEEVKQGARRDLSILTHLMQYGRDAIFLLV